MRLGGGWRDVKEPRRFAAQYRMTWQKLDQHCRDCTIKGDVFHLECEVDGGVISHIFGQRTFTIPTNADEP